MNALAPNPTADPGQPLPPQRVMVSRLGAGVAQITLNDIAGANGFNPDLIGGLVEAFADVGRDPEVRAVILASQGPYFCSGGTKEGLIAIHNRAVSFTDVKLYELPLRCEVPVVAAMGGHAIGGGLVMGLFADTAVLARESIYTANFMRYGFTPGMGGTFILPYKLGPALAHEMMLTGAHYRGSELQARGAPVSVVTRSEVLGRAVTIARDLAEKPRTSLTTLKRHLSRQILAELDTVVALELEMHAATFHQDDVAVLIERNFGA